MAGKYEKKWYDNKAIVGEYLDRVPTFNLSKTMPSFKRQSMEAAQFIW